jgi:peptide chain release factor 2
MPYASRWRCCGGIFDWDTAQERLAELNKRAEDPKLWNNPQAAQKVMRQRQALERSITAFHKLERELDDAITLIELGEAEKDGATIEEGEAALRKLAPDARRQEVVADRKSVV